MGSFETTDPAATTLRAGIRAQGGGWQRDITTADSPSTTGPATNLQRITSIEWVRRLKPAVTEDAQTVLRP